MIVVVMGVSGSGKSTIGPLLADSLRCPFLDGDSLHPAANIAKMSRGVPLTDPDRAPWLAAIRARLLDAFDRGQSLVIACSALKRSYRAFLEEGLRIRWVHLSGSEELIRSRLRSRSAHFVRDDLLTSQTETLEEPPDAIVADVSAPPAAIVARILAELRARPDVRVLADVEELSLAAGEAVVVAIADAVRATGTCSLALSGGSTPRALHRLLASRFRDRVEWARVHLFWGDERHVPAGDSLSNQRMARETLLDHVPCPPGNVHAMPTHIADPEVVAREYEATLRKYFAGDWPRFDIVLLGIGTDGHTASLVPGSPALEERTRWVVPVTAPIEPSSRLTLTPPVLNRSAHTHFLVAGSSKAHAVGRVLSGTADPSIFPAAAIQPDEGTVTWWLDREAAAERE